MTELEVGVLAKILKAKAIGLKPRVVTPDAYDAVRSVGLVADLMEGGEKAGSGLARLGYSIEPGDYAQIVRHLQYCVPMISEVVGDEGARMGAVILLVADCLKGDPKGWTGLRALGEVEPAA